MKADVLLGLPDRIVNRIDLEGGWPVDPVRPVEGQCWAWTGGRFTAGYGRTWFEGKARLVHQLVYEAAKGLRSDRNGHYLDHLCRVRHCCNPDHLEWSTPLGNQLTAQRPQCRKGHDFTPENTYTPIGKPNQRVCRKCLVLRGRAFRLRRKLNARHS